jgi:glycosyltransferase involved in cell wall biosynthesis
MRLGLVFSTEVGLRTQYQNWRDRLADTGSQTTVDTRWIVIEWSQPGGWVERLPILSQGIKGRIRSQLELASGLRQGPFDVLLVAAPTVMTGKDRLLAGQPYAISIDCTPRQLHGFGDLYGKGPSRFALYEHYKERARRRLYQNAAALFPWSHWAAQSMIDDYGAVPERVHVIPPGVDLDRWHVPNRPAPDPGDIQLLFVGGDFYRKGGDLLLEWARTTRRKNWSLHIVTRDSVSSPCERVKVYTGLGPNDPALVVLYRQADVFVLPTRGDCYSLASIEAMAAGLPVVLSQTGGTADIICDGQTGYLIAPGDRAALSDRLESLLAAPERCRVMGAAARCDAEARYDVVANIDRILSVLAQLR